MYSSTASISAKILSTHGFSPRFVSGFDEIASIACNDEPGQIGIASPGKS